MFIRKIALLLCICPMAFLGASKPTGLTNNDNRCFANASFQALSAMTDLTDLILTKTNFYNADSISAIYANFLNLMKHGEEEEISADQLAVAAWAMSGHEEGTQQDAEELISGLLDRLTDADIADDVKGDFPKYNRTNKSLNDISMLFSTLTHSYIRHRESGFKGTKRPEVHSLLSLPIHEKDSSLNQCLTHFFDGEAIEYTHKGENLDARKKQRLVETQDYILFGLKRNTPVIDEETQQQAISKKTGEPLNKRLSEAISFPLKGLQLDQYFKDKSKHKGDYDLIAVVMHTGSGMGGHYIAYVNRDNQWYLCNDEKIDEVSDADMAAIARRGYGVNKNMTATVLIYERSESVARKAAALPKKQPSQKDGKKPSNETKKEPKGRQNAQKPATDENELLNKALIDSMLEEDRQQNAAARNNRGATAAPTRPAAPVNDEELLNKALIDSMLEEERQQNTVAPRNRVAPLAPARPAAPVVQPAPATYIPAPQPAAVEQPRPNQNGGGYVAAPAPQAASAPAARPKGRAAQRSRANNKGRTTSAWKAATRNGGARRIIARPANVRGRAQTRSAMRRPAAQRAQRTTVQRRAAAVVTKRTATRKQIGRNTRSARR